MRAQLLPKPDDTVSPVGPDGGGRGRRQAALLRHFGLTPSTDFLEVGCGVGRLAYELADIITEGTYTGFDVSNTAIDWLNTNYAPHLPNFRFDLLDVYSARFHPDAADRADQVRFPYDDDSFDMSGSFAVFIHVELEPIRNYLRELARVMRPGSRSVHTFFALTGQEPRLLSGKPLHDVGGGRYTSNPKKPGGVWAYDDAVIRAAGEEAGLELVDFVIGTWGGRPMAEGIPSVGADAYVWTPKA